MKTVILMCDGLGSRWIDQETKYKHLIEFDGIPLILRTICQLRKYPCNIILIAPDDFKRYFKVPSGVVHTSLGYRENEERTLLNGIVRTQPFWGDDTSILLGDVVFSSHAIDLLFSDISPFWIMGRSGKNVVTGKFAGELFTLSFPLNLHGALLEELKIGGKLWNYYNTYPISLFSPGDYTDDFDSEQAYEQFYSKMLEAVRGDVDE